MRYVSTGIICGILQLMVFAAPAQPIKGKEAIRVHLQSRYAGQNNQEKTVIKQEEQEWAPAETAIIICDMWNQHWCKGATARVTELAPTINKVITIARKKGVLIVHAPSDCMPYYSNTPGRQLAMRYASKASSQFINEEKLPAEINAIWPVDQANEGCDDTPRCAQGNPWKKQIDVIRITSGDAISDSGEELAGLFAHRNIKNVILMGVHENMCVIGRSFGLRNMVRLGKNVVLMRDLTDAMYDSRQWPKVSHFAGTRLVTEYIEQYVCPTMLSTDFTGTRPFHFTLDTATP
jgi:nicotinamidase-related amidase